MLLPSSKLHPALIPATAVSISLFIYLESIRTCLRTNFVAVSGHLLGLAGIPFHTELSCHWPSTQENVCFSLHTILLHASKRKNCEENHLWWSMTSVRAQASLITYPLNPHSCLSTSFSMNLCTHAGIPLTLQHKKKHCYHLHKVCLQTEKQKCLSLLNTGFV